jgi:uncharacterized protein DUF4038/collagenase-like protein with putative collagen-binding domain
MAVRSVGRTRRSVVEVGRPVLGLAVVLGLVAILASSAGARPSRTGVSAWAAVNGVKKCRRLRVVRIKNGHRVHVRVKNCVGVRSKACRVTWSKQKRHGKVVIRRHNPVWVAKVRCPKAKKKTGGGTGPGGGGTRPDGGGTGPGGGGTGPGTGVAFPLKASSNGRFLETATNHPFLMVGDSPQSLIGNLTESSADSYFADRVAHGFDTVWINLLCDSYTACNSNGTTASGVKPFTVGTNPGSYNLADPNSTYFRAAHAIVADAEADGLEVMLDPIETGGCQSGGWLDTLVNNGDGTTNSSNADYRYGAFVATEFEDLPNVMWLMGNDFDCFGNSTADADVLAVAKGILSVTPHALISSEIGESGDGEEGDTSLDDTTDDWTTTLGLNGFYTYAPAYANARRAYAQTPTIPSFLAESNYEGEDNNGTDGCITVRNCRLQEWWAMTSGATGQLYGDTHTWQIAAGWTTGQVDTTGVKQLEYQTDLLETIPWYNLAPDTSNTLVTSGNGSCPTTGSIVRVSCVTAAETLDQTTALIYDPTGTSFTVNMGEMAGSTTAGWYDPTDGNFTQISGSPFSNSGSHSFTAPGRNSAGDSDWVLLLDG